jgi:WD40 repeat protein
MQKRDYNNDIYTNDIYLHIGHAEALLAVSFSPDGKKLASGSGDSSVRFWDLNTETPLTNGQSKKYPFKLGLFDLYEYPCLVSRP